MVNEIILKEGAKIIIGERFDITIVYPKYWNKNFVEVNKETLNKIFFKTINEFYVDSLKNGNKLVENLEDMLELDFVKDIQIDDKYIQKMFSEKTSELKRQTINYTEDKSALIDFYLGNNPIKKNDIRFYYDISREINFEKHSVSFGYFMMTLHKNNIVSRIRDVSIPTVIFFMYLMINFLQEVDLAISDFEYYLKANLKEPTEINFLTDKKYSILIDEIFSYIQKTITINKSKRIDTLKENSNSVLDYAKKNNIELGIMGASDNDIMDVSLRYKKLPSQVKSFLKNN